LTILHLSDLQFGRNHRYPKGKDSYQTLFAKLADDLAYLADTHEVAPNAVVVTGDMAQCSKLDEYKQAAEFFEKLLAKLKIGKQRVVIVPGNHDVNWNLCKGARETAAGRGQPFEEPCFAKFENYQDFFNQFYDGRHTFDEEHLFQVYPFPDERVLIAGLNSCMRESEEEADHYGWIGVDQARRAAETLDEKDPDRQCLRLAAMHHNFTSGSNLDNENLRDADEIRPALEKADFCLVLHGHRHAAGVEQRKSVKARFPLTILATGSAGLDCEALPDHPNQYQVIRLGNRGDVTLHMRQYSARAFGLAGEGKWVADPGVEEQGGIVPFDLGLPKKPKPTRARTPRSGFDPALKRFLAFLREEVRFVPLRGVGSQLKAPLELEPIYVSLRAVPSHFERDTARPKPREVQQVEEMEIGPALEFAEKHGYRGLVILGDPGSGKTTLLKWVALCLAQGKPKKETGLPSQRTPIFLPLRAVKAFGQSMADVLQAHYGAPELDLPAGFFAQLLRSRKCLVLLDGLDEVATPERRQEVGRWVERARKAYAGSLLVVTSRFAGYKGDARLPDHFLELHVRDFSDDDVKRFVREWYRQVETKQRGDAPQWQAEARSRADHLIRELSREDNQSLRDLAVNPLMLQILCLVHRTRERMPVRRTELYAKCMDVLLQEWDEAKELDVALTAAEARQVLRPFALWLHEEEGRTHADKEDVKQILLPELRRVKKDLTEVEEQLDRVLTSVRDRSGLFVGHDVTRYGFQHLSPTSAVRSRKMVADFFRGNGCRLSGRGGGG
jgi:predicted phosphodiesterase